MARKIKGVGEAPKTGFRSAPSVDHTDLGAAKLVTISDPPEGWGCLNGTTLLTTVGAFVRLRPPPGTSAEDVDRARKDALAHGALAVRVVAPNAPATVTSPVERAEPSPGSGIRETVMAMAKEANTRDREALMEALEVHMASAGI